MLYINSLVQAKTLIGETAKIEGEKMIVTKKKNPVNWPHKILI